jgi:hypothetical protein
MLATEPLEQFVVVRFDEQPVFPVVISEFVLGEFPADEVAEMAPFSAIFTHFRKVVMYKLVAVYHGVYPLWCRCIPD